MANEQLLSVKANREKCSSGICKLNYKNPLNFKKWKVSINRETEMVLAEFSFVNNAGRHCTSWHINPLNITFRDEVTFDNEKDWEVFKEECDTAFKSQLRKFPMKHKQQIEDSLNDLKFSKERIKLTDKSEMQIEFIYSMINNN